ncbi:MAG: TIGR03619 family F420-dependent LLM class oxidoreductase [Proteobacteria bacterium]|nr:TIGR03619 family F420-dependent LLM class oxidoreductase [Pseudomonadota bacterium]HQR03791.1 TIGR03619 family F420-dependent LLM class oxidoreductase [Rhodocyclaceae bacterium]
MRFWQCMSYTHPAECVALARSAEQAGFDGLAMAEHYLYPVNLVSRHPYSPPDAPAFEAGEFWAELMTTFAAMATVTTRLQFLSAVHVLPLQNPFYMAKVLGTLSHLSADRVMLGAGAGWMAEEFEIFGVDFKSRGRRFDEMVALMRTLWAAGPATFAGEFFRCDQVLMKPEPSRPIPVWIGGKTEVALRRAARIGDGWVGTGEGLEESIALATRLQELRREYGRDHLPFRVLSYQLWGSYDDADLKRMATAGITEVGNWVLPFAMGAHQPGLEARQAYLLKTGAEIRARFGWMDE